MSIIKKTLFVAMAVATISTAGAPFTASQANAGYHYGGGYHYPVCGWKWVKWKDYYGWHRKRKWVCH